VSTPFQVAIDCADPHRLARFWAEAMGYEVEEQDEDFIRSMVAEGHATEADTAEVDGKLVWREGAACNDPDGRLPRLYFQLVPEPKAAKNRVHLDLRVGQDRHEAEVERLVALGARRLWDGRQGPHTWVTMADPEGNEFCVA
jgi:Glyoxalase-like domain